MAQFGGVAYSCRHGQAEALLHVGGDTCSHNTNSTAYCQTAKRHRQVAASVPNSRWLSRLECVGGSGLARQAVTLHVM